MVETLNLGSLEKYLDIYPWYSIGYLELYNRLSSTPMSENLASKVAPRLFSRQAIYDIYIETTGTAPTAIAIEQTNSHNEITDISTEEKENDVKFYMVGGDYFSRKDFEMVQLNRNSPIDKFIEDKPTLLRSALGNRRTESSAVKESECSFDAIFDDAEFYTETLATIYTEQGYYKRALEIYAKLILLYPEKSSYFAALVKDLKSKHNL